MLPPHLAAELVASRQADLARAARARPPRPRRPVGRRGRRGALARPVGHLFIAVGLRLLARDASALMAR